MAARLGTLIDSGNGVELGTMSTASRNAGVSTSTGTIIYNSTSNSVEAYFGSSKGWQNVYTAV